MEFVPANNPGFWSASFPGPYNGRCWKKEKLDRETRLQLQQRVAELERERDIVQDSNRKLIEQSEELKERVAAQERQAAATEQDEDQGILQDMLLQLQGKWAKWKRSKMGRCKLASGSSSVVLPEKDEGGRGGTAGN